MNAVARCWWEDELAACTFNDARLGQRLHRLVAKMERSLGASLPVACQDWANTKAAYRFFANKRVSEAQILSGHFAATRERVRASDGPVLVLQDTTEFTFPRESREAVGLPRRVNSGRDKAGQVRMHTLCGLLMHASLAVTADGLPLGLAAVKFWSREKFKGTNALKRKVNPTRVPIEQKDSFRWLKNLRQTTVLFGAPSRCIHVRDRAGRLGTAAVELRYRRITVLPPIGKQKRYSALSLTVLRARAPGVPKDRPRSTGG